MAMTASNAAVLPVFWIVVLDVGAGAAVVFVRSVIEAEERRSVAEARREDPAVEVDWTWEAAYIL